MSVKVKEVMSTVPLLSTHITHAQRSGQRLKVDDPMEKVHKLSGFSTASSLKQDFRGR